MTLDPQPSIAQHNIFYKTKLHFDVEKLQEHLRKYVFHLKSERQTPAFGGWSVLSGDGTYQDGWQMGHLAFRREGKADQEGILRKLGFYEKNFDQPTEVCHGYMAEVIEQIRAAKFNPRRARIIELFANSCSSWHRDSAEDRPFYRLHIPIFSNPLAKFLCESGEVHLPADGSAYVLRVNQMHKVVNDGSENRYHLVIDVNVSQAVKDFLA